LKCVVIDEADFFFHDDRNFDCIQSIKNYKHLKDNLSLQWILFSATYPKDEDHGKYEQV
jgi:superfamily II DNA/RNA helicase